MKKFFFGAACLAMMASCSNNDSVSEMGSNNQQDAITLSVSTKGVSVNTKGMGTVGQLEGQTDDDNSNMFAGTETFKVIMTTVGEATWDYTQSTMNPGDVLKPILDSEEVTPTYDGLEKWNLVWKNMGGRTKYYPLVGSSDFFAYHLDDCTIDGTAKTDSEMTIDFTMDGSQDILAGKATNATGSYGGTTNYTGFSSKTARNGIVPAINLQHMLTRFTFECNNDAADLGNGDASISVKSIKVESYNKGTLLVAYNETAPKAASDLLAVNTAEPKVNLTLAGITAPEQIHFDTPTPLGDALFVTPGETAYKMTIEVEAHHNGEGTEPLTQTFAQDIVLPAGAAFAQGTSYNVKIQLHGLQEITLEVALEEWKNGGDIELDGDNGTMVN